MRWQASLSPALMRQRKRQVMRSSDVCYKTSYEIQPKIRSFHPTRDGRSDVSRYLCRHNDPASGRIHQDRSAMEMLIQQGTASQSYLLLRAGRPTGSPTTGRASSRTELSGNHIIYRTTYNGSCFRTGSAFYYSKPELAASEIPTTPETAQI